MPKQWISTFSQVHGTFSRIDHILGHKSRPGKLKKIKIVLGIFSDHNALRVHVNYKGETTTINLKYKHMEAKQHTSE